MRDSDWTKVVNHEKQALTKQNQADREEFLGQNLPDPVVILPKYWDSDKVQVKLIKTNQRS